MKAYDTVATIIELQDVVRDKTPPPIVSFQNGVGNEESIGAAFGEQNVVAATLTTAVSIPEYGIVVEEKQRGVAIGMDAPDAEVVAAAFEATLLETTRIQTGASLKWSKLLLNMLANATCAILDMSPGEVFKNPDLFQIERDALREALGIMKIKGIPPASLPGADVRTLGHAVSLLPAWALRPLLGSRVSGGRGDKLPSLHLALRQNHSRSEVPWLNGGVVQAAESLGRLVPVNHALALTLSDIITGRAPWDMFRNQPDMLISAVNAAQRKAR
jgi:2-dehydropantoate 2-reductase